MSTDGPNASWHPAMMPNSIREASAGSSEHVPMPSATKTDAPAPTLEASPPDGAAGEDERDEDANDVPPEDGEPAEPAASAPAAKAFDWGDADDAEWSLGRRDTDPFKFMPAKDRTNSFPAVPPLGDEAATTSFPHLDSTRLEPIPQDVEDEADGAEGAFAAPAEPSFEDKVAEAEADAEDDSYMGGDTRGAEEEADDARYEEGVPLMAQAEAEEEAALSPTAAAPTAAAFGAPFGEDEGADGDDDFFSQAAAAAPARDTAPHLTRKSTMQVIDATRVGSIAAASTLDDTPEADEEEAVDGAEAKEEKDSAAPPVDLDAKWKEAFADDDEDFLLDDGNAAKEVDPADFFGSDDEGFLDDSPEASRVPSPPPVTTQQQQQQPAPLPATRPRQDSTSRYVPENASPTAPAAPPNPYAPTPITFAPTAPAVQNPYGQPAVPAPTPYTPLARQPIAQPPPYFQQQHQAARPEPPVKAESFVAKSKGGYQSPYDLPMQVVKLPRKRQSMQQLPRPAGGPSTAPAPPRSSSMLPPQGVPFSPPTAAPPVAAAAPPHPPASAPPRGPPQRTSSQTSAKHADSFFEELPSVPVKPRPASRQSNASGSAGAGGGMPSPVEPPPYAAAARFPGPPPTSQPAGSYAPPTQTAYAPAPAPAPAPADLARAGLVAPDRVSPYAPLGGSLTGSSPGLVPAATNARYSPAPAQQVAGPPGAPTRYSPAPSALPPPNGRPSSAGAGYGAPPQQAHPAVGQPMLAHLPRTSSPLAHFEMSHHHHAAAGHQHPNHPAAAAFSPSASSSDGSQTAPYQQQQQQPDLRRASSSSSAAAYDARIHRVPSLPPTQELPESDDLAGQQRQAASRGLTNGAPTFPPGQMQVPTQEPRSAKPPSRPSQTPPPIATGGGALRYSPSKQPRNPYAPVQQGQAAAAAAPPHDFAPPPRSHTQSPGATRYGPAGVGSRGSVAGTRQTADPIPRPSSSSVTSPTSPPSHSNHYSALRQPATLALPTRPRGLSQNLNYIPPQDGSAADPLQRWKGAPVFAWGIGGTVVTSFPKDVPRYGAVGGAHPALPSVLRSPGEVRVRSIKELQPLEDRLAKFPGPLKGKAKKKDALAWLRDGADQLEKSLPDLGWHHQQQYHQSNNNNNNNGVRGHDHKRAEERLLLWKILAVFVEHDGALEGSPAVDEAVRNVLAPGAATIDAATSLPYSSTFGGSDAMTATATTTTPAVQAESVDPATVEQVKAALLVGDRERAVWTAVDRRLWGHAFVVSAGTSRDLYRKVVHEFVRAEVNRPGAAPAAGNGPLAALYQVLAGNADECVDELVPVHARAGLQLLSTGSGGHHANSNNNNNNGHVAAAAAAAAASAAAAAAQQDDALAGLDRWRDTLTLVLSNRSANDAAAIANLGRLLAGYGRAEAAHVCFLFARGFALFGGLDEPGVDFVLLGADHRAAADADRLGRDTESLLLSEVYEYGLGLAATAGAPSANAASGGSGATTSAGGGGGGVLAGPPAPPPPPNQTTSHLAAQVGCPHLSAYKLQHALVLAEHGHRDRALAYCEAIDAAVHAATRRSPYHHQGLELAAADLLARLKQTAREEGSAVGSWIPKPNINKVSDTMWNRFNKFVAGDEADGSGTPGNGAAAGTASPGEGGGGAGDQSGPFARIASGTPTISRPPSAGAQLQQHYLANGGLDPYGVGGGAAYFPTQPAAGSASPGSAAASRSASRYAPASTAPGPVHQTVPGPHGRYEPAAGGAAGGGGGGGGYAPMMPAVTRQDTLNSTGSYDFAASQQSNPLHDSQPAYGYGPLAGSISAAGAQQQGYGYQPALPPQQQQHGIEYGAPSRENSYMSSLQLDSLASSQASLLLGHPHHQALYNPGPVPADAGGAAAAAGRYSPYAAATPVMQPANGPMPPARSSIDEPSRHKPAPQGPLAEVAPVGYGAYEPPSFMPHGSDEPPPPPSQDVVDAATGGYEPPPMQQQASYSSYEPPSYQPDLGGTTGVDDADEGSEDESRRRKKKQFYDDDDEFAPAAAPSQKDSAKPREKTRAEKDRENEELVRRAAEEDANRAAAQKAARKSAGWGFGGWFGGGGGPKSLDSPAASSSNQSQSGGGAGTPNKPIRANLGEASSFVYDPDLKRWVQKGGAAADTAPKSATPPPPKGPPRSVSASMPPPAAAPTSAPTPPLASAPPDAAGRASAPPGGATPPLPPAMMRSASSASSVGGAAGGALTAGTGTIAPPSRPPTSMSNASSIDDLLGAPGPRKGGAAGKKAKKGRGYVDVMAK